MSQLSSDEPENPPGALQACGPSFPLSLKSLASLLVLALAAWGIKAWPAVAAAQWNGRDWIFLATVVLVVLVGYFAILASTTTIDSKSIRQNWLWVKEARLDDIRQVKLIRVPGFDWLIVPRLVVRTSGLGVMSFPAGTPALLSAFRLLAHGERPSV